MPILIVIYKLFLIILRTDLGTVEILRNYQTTQYMSLKISKKPLKDSGGPLKNYKYSKSSKI